MSAMKPATPGAPYALPPEPNRLPAILLALGVHALLLAFLWLGVSWQNQEPVAVEAEVWDMKVETAAAPPPPPPPQEEPEPAPRPEPTPPPQKAVEPEPVRPSAADIRLERDKKLAELKKQREDVQRRERELAEQRKKEDDKKKLADQKEREKKEKAEADKKLAQKADEEKKKKLALEKAAKAKADAAEQAKIDKIRADELKRLMGAAGTTGNAQKSSAPKSDAGYQAAIAAKVKSNMAYAGSTDEPGNPRAVFRVEQLPTGEIMSVRLTKSSGVPQFDDAVERAINKSSPLPKRKDGTVERSVVVGFAMKDLD